MSLATSCPSCGTVFKVVEDQLKVSEGWVRCGHCHDVFNALEGLFDLERRDSVLQGLRTLPAALDISPPDDGASRNAVGTAGQGVSQNHAETPTEPGVAQAPALAPPLAEQPPVALDNLAGSASKQRGEQLTEQPRQTSSGSERVDKVDDDRTKAQQPTIPTGATQGGVAGDRYPDSSSALHSGQVESTWNGDLGDTVIADDFAPFGHPQSESAQAEHDASPTFTDSDQVLSGKPSPVTSREEEEDSPFPAFYNPDTSHHDDLPEFVLDAERRAWWTQPIVRTGLVACALSLVALLATQVVMHRRDHLAAQCGACKPAIEPVVEFFGLSIRPPVDLEAVEVDNAILTHPPGVEGYRLTVQVRNRGEHVVAAPHMELSLTDASGGLLVRRVFSPGDFAQTESLAAQGEATWTLEFQTAQKRLSGYTVAAFYP